MAVKVLFPTPPFWLVTRILIALMSLYSLKRGRVTIEQYWEIGKYFYYIDVIWPYFVSIRIASSSPLRVSGYIRCCMSC